MSGRGGRGCLTCMLMVRIAVHEARATKRQTAKLPSPRCRRSDTPPAANKTNLDARHKESRGWCEAGSGLVTYRWFSHVSLLLGRFVLKLIPWTYLAGTRPAPAQAAAATSPWITAFIEADSTTPRTLHREKTKNTHSAHCSSLLSGGYGTALGKCT